MYVCTYITYGSTTLGNLGSYVPTATRQLLIIAPQSSLGCFLPLRRTAAAASYTYIHCRFETQSPACDPASRSAEHYGVRRGTCRLAPLLHLPGKSGSTRW